MPFLMYAQGGDYENLTLELRKKNGLFCWGCAENLTGIYIHKDEIIAIINWITQARGRED